MATAGEEDWPRWRVRRSESGRRHHSMRRIWVPPEGAIPLFKHWELLTESFNHMTGVQKNGIGMYRIVTNLTRRNFVFKPSCNKNLSQFKNSLGLTHPDFP